MKLFKFDNYKLTISEEALLIKAFRDIWERDKSPDKLDALLELGIIYFMVDPRSDYSWIGDMDEKLENIRKHEGVSKSWKPDKKFNIAIEVYKEMVVTTASLLLDDTRTAINNARAFLRELKLDDVDDKGKPKYTINSFISAVRDIPKLVKDLSEAEKAIAQEIDEQSRRRGNKVKGVTEDGFNNYI